MGENRLSTRSSPVLVILDDRSTTTQRSKSFCRLGDFLRAILTIILIGGVKKRVAGTEGTLVFGKTGSTLL
jgi:hypothetical protein